MKIIVDSDVAKAAEFMMRNIPGPKLQPVTQALKRLADCLWSEYYDGTPLRAFDIERDPIHGADRPDCSIPQLATSALAREIDLP